MLYDIGADWASVPLSSRPSFMLCLYTGARTPPHCAPMPRVPAAATGGPFGPGFLASYGQALAINPAIHDGAVLLRRSSAEERHRVAAWSMRLYPPPAAACAEPNRGSAFNSCLEMSCVSGVDRMFLVTEGSLIRFENGRWDVVA